MMNKDINVEYATFITLKNEIDKILFNYMEIYEEYYTNGNRDSAHLKDLVDSLLGISAVLEVYVRDKGINSNYAVEKLNSSKQYIESCIKYFENKE